MSAAAATVDDDEQRSLRRVALDMAKDTHKEIRQAMLKVAGAIDDGGSVLYQLISESPVPGKGDDVPDEMKLGPDTNRTRHARSEWVHKVGAVLLRLLRHMDIVTSDVGRDPDRTFYGYKVEKLWTWSRETLPDAKSQRTTERALWVLHQLGLVESWRRSRDRQDGTHVGLTSVRKLSIDEILRATRDGALAWWHTVRTAESKRRASRARPTPMQQIRASLAGKRQARRKAGDGESVHIGDTVRGLQPRAGPS